ncbi:MAG: hypothetical protein ACLP1Y_02960 [Candidatus Acidiferrales bacterium]
MPADSSDRSLFSDWGDPHEYTLGDMGVGECAGEVVSAVEFDLAASEREVFEAQVAFENGQVQQAGTTAYRSMVHAAKALVKLMNPNISACAPREGFRAKFSLGRKNDEVQSQCA